MNDEPASTAAWKRLEPRRVLVADLLPSHPTRPEYVADKHRAWWRSHSGDIYPHVLRVQGQLVIRDGHHRIARARQLGQRWIWARVHDPEE